MQKSGHSLKAPVNPSRCGSVGWGSRLLSDLECWANGEFLFSVNPPRRIDGCCPHKVNNIVYTKTKLTDDTSGYSMSHDNLPKHVMHAVIFYSENLTLYLFDLTDTATVSCSQAFFYYHSHLKALFAVVFISPPHEEFCSCLALEGSPLLEHIVCKSLPRIDAFNFSLYNILWPDTRLDMDIHISSVKLWWTSVAVNKDRWHISISSHCTPVQPKYSRCKHWHDNGDDIWRSSLHGCDGGVELWGWGPVHTPAWLNHQSVVTMSYKMI